MKKRVFLCALCLLLFASCGRQPSEPQQTATVGEEIAALPADETTLDIPDEIVTAEQPQAKELTCVPLQKDGKVYGFEMRFRRTNALETMMASEDNFYFAVLQCGKRRIAVPTEEIRVLLDVPTDSFVATLLVPQDAKLSGSSATVTFCISARSDGASKALFTAQQTVDFSE